LIVATVLITGANRGIGLEFVRQYAAAGWSVIAACRLPNQATALRAIAGEVRMTALDVADAAQVAALADELKDQPIDVLINNAGISGTSGRELAEIDVDDWLHVMRVNVAAPILVASALLDNLRRGRRRQVIFISSTAGSIARNTGVGGGYVYRSSKAALNMAVRSFANDLTGEGITAVAIHPGWVRTDMGGERADLSVEDSVKGMRVVIEGLVPSQTGAFLAYDGAVLPW
jgi:NAD(P)-dependent dehydrogenase (short-subunit alcohol dehydrogenase family)